MADQRDFELLDDYLTDRLSDRDRSAFEQKLKADPDLQHEYALQKRLIQGIKDARVAQLKSMLNQVPVPSASTGNALATKVLLGTLATLIIAAAAFWYYRDEPAKIEPSEAPSTQQQQQTAPNEQPAISEAKPEAEPSQKPVAEQKQVQETDKNQTSAGTEHSKPSLAKKPDPVSAPVAKNNTDKNPAEAMAVMTNQSHATYSFHYNLENDTLVLFGPFEEGTYELIELTESGKTIRSLFYKEKYYRLDDTGNEVRSLSPVTDASFLKKLQEQHRTE